MKKQKTLIKALLPAVLILAAGLLGGCGSGAGGNKSGRTSIVATNFPAYDFARQIAGEYADITLLIRPGTDVHSYEPTPQDIIRVQSCDLFIYTGGTDDKWAEDILAASEERIETVEMLDCCLTLGEELVEGMEDDHDDHDDGDGHDGHDDGEVDKHVWTSPVNAKRICAEILSELTESDAANAAGYRAAYDSYAAQLDSLDSDIRIFISTLSKKLLIFGDRFPFRYFTEEYGLDYYAAFPGCSSDSEPSMKTVAFLTDKAREENVGAIYYIEGSNHLIADSIAASAGTKTAMLHSCHHITQAEFDGGATYISLMRQNLSVLKDTMS